MLAVPRPGRPSAEHALNGLLVSEATGADIEALGVERGRRTLAIVRRGGKKATIPLPAAPLSPNPPRGFE